MKKLEEEVANEKLNKDEMSSAESESEPEEQEKQEEEGTDLF